MGNNTVIKNSKNIFIEQLKIDQRSENKVLGIYINPHEFPQSGLIIITNKIIFNYSPVTGLVSSSYLPNMGIIFCEYNRKSKEGSVIAIVTEDNKLHLINTGNLTLLRSTAFDKDINFRIKENAKITALNFKLSDTVFLGYSDGSIIKAKFNEQPINLLYENSNKFKVSAEDEFENIKSVFSTDLIRKQSGNNGGNNSNSINISNNNTGIGSNLGNKNKPTTDSFNKNPNLISEKTTDNLIADLSNEPTFNLVEFILISDRYKTLFAIQKLNAGLSIINLFCLRNNIFNRRFCKIEGTINNSKLIEKKDLIVIITFNVDKKLTKLEIWHFNENECPVSVYNLSSLLEYPFSVRTTHITPMPKKYLGRSSKQGLVDGDLIFLGTTRGDIVLGKISNSYANNKHTFDMLNIFKLKNDTQKGEDMSNCFEISFIYFDLFFDLMILGDVNSNVRFLEKILQIGKPQSIEETLPFFSFEDEENLYYKSKLSNRNKNEIFTDLPLFSVNHDVIKDRSIIMYDEGKDLLISSCTEEEVESNLDSEMKGNRNKN